MQRASDSVALFANGNNLHRYGTFSGLFSVLHTKHYYLFTAVHIVCVPRSPVSSRIRIFDDSSRRIFCCAVLAEMSSSALMKRARVEPFAPKMIRRGAKRGGGGGAAGGRMNETLLNSTPLFVYVKLSFVWFALLSFDVISGGFRFEVLWPTWLLLRNGYDAFAYRGTTAHLPYSAHVFSLFFVCVTITSDLLCFLFIPVPLLLFVASSYVWIHHIWQSSDRTFSTPAIVSYVTVILFEYIWRYGYESPWLPYRSLASALGLSRLLPARKLESYDSPSPDSFPWPLLMCRPFAAHCIGYPIVMFGFEARAFWTSWRMKRKQREVAKSNEFYTELLCAAVPCAYEAGKRYMFSHVSPHGSYDNEVCEYEIENPAIMSSATATTAGAACNNGNANNTVALYNPVPTVTTTSKKARSSFSHKNGNTRVQYLRKQGNANSHAVGNGTSHNGTSVHINGHEDTDTSSERGRSRSPLVVRTRSPMIVRVISGILQAILLDPLMFLTRFVTSLTTAASVTSPSTETNGSVDTYGSAGPAPKSTTAVDKFPHRQQLIPPSGAQPPTSGQGSGALPADEADDSQGDAESEDGHQNQNSTCSSSKSSHAGSSSRKKPARRARGRTPQAPSAPFVESVPSSQPNLLQVGNNTSYCNSAANEWEDASSFVENSSGKEPKGNKKDKESNEIEKLRLDLRAERDRNTELKSQEQKLRTLLSEAKTKQDQLDVKLANVTRQRDQEKSNAHLFERRLNDLIVKKSEVDAQLNAEKKRNTELAQKVDDLQHQLKSVPKPAVNGIGKQLAKENSSDESLKSKNALLERENKNIRQELKNREETIDEREAELKQLREFRDSHCEEKVRQIIEQLQSKNVHLEASLRAENKLKQELFRALGVTRDQIDVLRERVHYLEKQLPEFASPSATPPSSSSTQNPFDTTETSQSCVFLSSSLPLP
uniref:Macoilin n=1 Tax=Steinernema glaseri TaxID=37863 RepID=A0A1I8ATL9_9BILA